jgi:hypothetical protein
MCICINIQHIMYYFIVPWNHIKIKNVLEAGEQLQLYIHRQYNVIAIVLCKYS